MRDPTYVVLAQTSAGLLSGCIAVDKEKLSQHFSKQASSKKSEISSRESTSRIIKFRGVSGVSGVSKPGSRDTGSTRENKMNRSNSGRIPVANSPNLAGTTDENEMNPSIVVMT